MTWTVSVQLVCGPDMIVVTLSGQLVCGSDVMTQNVLSVWFWCDDMNTLKDSNLIQHNKTCPLKILKI